MDICEQIASTEAIDLAIKYAIRVNKKVLANKLESIADAKEQKKEKEDAENHRDNFTSDNDSSINVEDIDDIPIPVIKKPDVEIKPLSMSQTLKRINPFLKTGNSPVSSRGKELLFLFRFNFYSTLYCFKSIYLLILLYLLYCDRSSWLKQFTGEASETRINEKRAREAKVKRRF